MIKTTATNKKIREILKATRDGALIPRPEFQRRLVWTTKDKDKFIETVIKGFPFPEIYMCNGEINVETGEGTQLLVDGLQRVNTLNEYFDGEGDFTHVLTKPYRLLTPEEKGKFLEYSVVVRDLGDLTQEQIIEVFRRLNSTQYTLREMEINNAIYNGALKKFCERVAEDEFFERHRFFSASDRKRMGDISFCLLLVATMKNGYFNRESEHESMLSSFNEAFPYEDEYWTRIRRVLDFIEECGFEDRSRVWKKADFFSAFVELDHILNEQRLDLQASAALRSLESLYTSVEDAADGRSSVAEIYYKSALQASNDRGNRIKRGIIVGGKLATKEDAEILEDLAKKA
jgi:hypothetical protein